MSYVLVVDDEEPLRNLLRRQLIGWGYSVRTAANADEALELMIAEPATIAVVDIDLRSPGQDGLWLADRIRETWKQTVIIIASGADEIEIADGKKSRGEIAAYVVKPYDRDLLRETLARAKQKTG
jgi:DNA-binding NtrC family response regulator